MTPIKLQFADFYFGFDSYNNYFYHLLSKYYTIIISDSPDILIFSNYGRNHYKYNCIKIFFSGENPFYDNGENHIYSRKQYDYLIDHQFINSSRHFRLPLFVCYDGYLDLIKNRNQTITANDIIDKKFCNFIYSNDNSPVRKVFFNWLNEYKKVDSGGKVMNNLGYLVKDKRQFIKDYKFTIAFENTKADGYTTEKLFEPLSERSIPIYWGNPKVSVDFNPEAFLYLDDINNIKDIIDKIIRIDTNDKLYLEYVNSPAFPHNNILPDYAHEENFIDWFDKIFYSKASRIKYFYIKYIACDKIY